MSIARELGRPLVGTGDVAVSASGGLSQPRGAAVRADQVDLPQPKLSFETNEFYLRSSDEMAGAFEEWPEALASTVAIAERCNVELELGQQLIPRYPTPDGFFEREYLRTLVSAGLRSRYGDPPPEEAVKRAEYELSVVDRMGYSAYFLIVWDFVKLRQGFRNHGRPGRGQRRARSWRTSLRITDVDPPPFPRASLRALPEPRARVPCPTSTSTSRSAAGSA